MPWSGGMAGDGRSSCSKDPRRDGQPPSSAAFLGGRDWEKGSLETAAPWNTGRVSRPISWGHYLFIHNMLVQTYILWKFIGILPVPLLGKRQAERRALSLGGRTVGRASDLRKRALDLMGKEEDRGSPVLIPSIWSICDCHEHSHSSASAAVGQVLWGRWWKLPPQREFSKMPLTCLLPSLFLFFLSYFLSLFVFLFLFFDEQQ